MPTVTLEPSSIGTSDQWTLSGGANKYAAVTLPDDEATTRIQSTTDSDRQDFIMEDMPADANVINSFSMTTRASESAANAADRNVAREGAGNENGVENALTTS